MAHFAKIENNKVVQVIVVRNEDCKNLQFPQSESVGQEFIQSIGLEGEWIQTSYNGNFRKNYAGIGHTYHRSNDAFIPAKPYESWILNQETFNWEAPKPEPNDGVPHIWNEEEKDWEIMPNYEVE